MASASSLSFETVIRGQAERRRPGEPEPFEVKPYGHAHADLAFGTLLDVVRAATPRLGAAGGGGKTSPSQMFEPPNPDSHGRRLEALKQEDRLYLQRKNEVQARNVTPESHVSLGRSPAESAGEWRVGGRGSEAHVTRADVSEASTNLGRGAPGVRDVEASIGSARPALGVGRRGGMDRGKGGVRSSLDVQLSPPSGNSDRPAELSVVAPAGPSPVASATGSNRGGSTPAQQVASMLAAGRNTAEPGRIPSGSLVSATQESSLAGTAPGGARTPEAKAPTWSRAATYEGSLKLGSGARSAGAEPALERFDDLVRSIRLFAGGQGARHSSARLQLEPPELGRIRVHLRVTGHALTLEVRTETDEARDLLAGRAAVLANALEQHGMHVQRLDVAREPVGHPEFGASPDGHPGPGTTGQDSGALSDEASSWHGRENGTVSREYGPPSGVNLVTDLNDNVDVDDGINVWSSLDAAHLALHGVDIRV